MKKLNLLILFALIFCLLNNSILNAQEESTEEENPFSISCDLMSRYVWRGTDFGGSPSIQPGIEYSKGGLTVGTWGAFTTNLPGVQETDLYLSYTLKEKFSLTFTDYFFPDETNPNFNYFDYRDETTGHVFEATASFNGTEKFPLTVLVAANVWGADARKINADGTTGSIQYSTYTELAYSFKYLDVFMGFNLTDPDENVGETGFYGDSFGVVNLGISATKEIKITNVFKLPLTVSLITNPQAEKIFMVAGFSF